MNWEAIGAVGELLGAIAVIGSLLFVGVQIRSNTRSTQVAAAHDLTNTFITVLKTIADDPDLTRIWLQQLQDASTLSVSDVERMMIVNLMTLKAFEDAFHHHRMGQMSDEMWEGWQAFIVTITNYPGMRHYWKYRKNFYSRSFQAFVDNPPPIETMLAASEFIDTVIKKENI